MHADYGEGRGLLCLTQNSSGGVASAKSSGEHVLKLKYTYSFNYTTSDSFN